MQKKIISSSILLLLLLLGCCGDCFALSLNSIQNEVNNFVGIPQKAKDFIQSNQLLDSIQWVENNTNFDMADFNHFYITTYGSTYGRIAFWNTLTDEDDEPFDDNIDIRYANSKGSSSTTKGYQFYCYSNVKRIIININNSKNTDSSSRYYNTYISDITGVDWNTGDIRYSQNLKTDNSAGIFLNIDKPIYTAFNWQIINDKSDIYTYYNNPQNFFDFTPNSNLELVSVNGFQNCYYIKNSNWVNGFQNLGSIFKSSNFNTVEIERYYYNNTTYNWNRLGTINRLDFLSLIDSNNTLNIDLMSTKYTNGGYVYRLTFKSNTIDFNDIVVNIYIESSNDIVNGGVLNTSDTFSGDFYDNYNNTNNNIETQEKIDNVSDTLTDDSQIDDMMTGLLSGDNLLNEIGFSPIDNPFTSVVLQVVTDVTDIILGSGHEVIEIGWRGHTEYLDSDDFVLPNGIIKTFISLISNGFLVWAIFKYGFKLYEWINEGRLNNLMNEATGHDYYLF